MVADPIPKFRPFADSPPWRKEKNTSVRLEIISTLGFHLSHTFNWKRKPTKLGVCPWPLCIENKLKPIYTFILAVK